ncbi:MAG: hypothetical protein IIY44_05815 [Erysipelotrichales bacterium]|nr:hypothetical protein [Erysipelotrichales bacterium]MBQ1387104.1 hypothetical protein [Erysipelotrichales bacterium]MBQ2310846.1 hypothetical protein [Erysipelotrichales bacterium]MBQ4012176.1 hypothetical protein [Erysipelotrichales bacterium]MBQ5541626.1 hypothetical protein [Erysipelotrichales bacterium]
MFSGLKIYGKVLLAPFEFLGWFLGAGSLFADAGMKLTGAKPYSLRRR